MYENSFQMASNREMTLKMTQFHRKWRFSIGHILLHISGLYQRIYLHCFLDITTLADFSQNLKKVTAYSLADNNSKSSLPLIDQRNAVKTQIHVLNTKMLQLLWRLCPRPSAKALPPPRPCNDGTAHNLCSLLPINPTSAMPTVLRCSVRKSRSAFTPTPWVTWLFLSRPMMHRQRHCIQ